MTKQQKILEEFDELMDKLWDKYGESYEVYNPKEFTREIESFLATSIQEAVAESQEQTISALCRVLDARGIRVPDIASLVEYLQKELTKKE